MLSTIKTKFIIIVLLLSCNNQSTEVGCGQGNKVLTNFFEQLKNKKEYGYSELLNDNSILILDAPITTEYFSKAIKIETKSEKIKMECSDISFGGYFPKLKAITPKELTPSLYSKNGIIEFTPLYEGNNRGQFLLGMTFSCGNNCGSIELFIIEKVDDIWGIKEMKNIGVM